MSDQRYLIVNADDFGLSRGVTGGIIEAHEHGIVTSASLMVRWPAVAAAAAFARAHPSMGLGFHRGIGEWTGHDGSWDIMYQVVPGADGMAAATEVSRQPSAFHCLVGRGPTHIDSHQHAHLWEPVRSVVQEAARRLVVRERSLRNISTPARCFTI